FQNPPLLCTRRMAYLHYAQGDDGILSDSEIFLRLVCFCPVFHEVDISADFYRSEGGNYAVTSRHLGNPCLVGSTRRAKAVVVVPSRSASAPVRLSSTAVPA